MGSIIARWCGVLAPAARSIDRIPESIASPVGFALSRSTIAFFSPVPDNLWTMYTMPSKGATSATAVPLDVTAPAAVPNPDGGFFVAGRHSPTTQGLYAVKGGSAKLYQAIAPAWAVPQHLTASSGRLVFSDTAESAPGAALWSLQTTWSNGTVVLGNEARLASDVDASLVPEPLFASAARTLYLAGTAGGRELVVRDGSAEEWSTPWTSTLDVEGMSGDQVLLHTISTANWWTVSTATGAQRPVTTNIAAIGGRFLYYQGSSKGQLLKLDLTEPPTSAGNPVQVRAADNCGIGPGNLTAWGDWIAYHCTGKTSNLWQALNTVTGTTVNLPNLLDRLGDGVMVYQSAGVLYAIDLNSNTTSAIGDLGSATDFLLPQLYTLDAGAEQVAWLAADQHLHVAPLPITASPPSVLDAHTDPGLTSGGIWHNNVDLSKPVSWKIVIKNSAHAVVSTLKGSAKDGSIRAAWDGTATGAPQPPPAPTPGSSPLPDSTRSARPANRAH